MVTLRAYFKPSFSTHALDLDFCDRIKNIGLTAYKTTRTLSRAARVAKHASLSRHLTASPSRVLARRSYFTCTAAGLKKLSLRITFFFHQPLRHSLTITTLPMRSASASDYTFNMAPSALGPSLPDDNSPVKSSLDPVGTPRRSGSLASSANTMYNHSLSNPTGSRAASRMATHYPTDDASAANLWARYTQCKDTDVAKNLLLEVIFSSEF